MSKAKILITDDDPHIGNLVETLLLQEGYSVLRAYSGTEALMVLEREQPDLMLLDLMLPGLSGEEVLRRTQQLPIIVCSAKADVDNKVALLLGGAVDYITKPFDTKELLARITVALRRQNVQTAKVLTVGEIRLATDTRNVTVANSAVSLTRTEYAILKLLMQNPDNVLTKSAILDQISVDTPDCTENSLKQHVSNLRKKLMQAGLADPIESVWGIGFKLKVTPCEIKS